MLARETRLAEEGSVSSFDLTVVLEDGSIVSGRWRPATASSRLLLQTQVPGISAEVLVWRVAETGAANMPRPLIIQVVDPSVVVPQQP